jgi:MarR family 2-MHQ and catechol resistance regulon transcriptional repressor
VKQVSGAIELYRALSALARRYQFRSRDEVCCYGLTVSQCYALEVLVDRDAVPASTLSAALGLDLSSTTRLVDQMVRKKLVTRKRSPVDARVREIRITDGGSRLIGRIEEEFGRLLEDALSGMPDNVRKALPSTLRRLAGTLDSACPPGACSLPGTKKRTAS